MPSAAQILVDFLCRQGVDRAFCVPGESYIALLDAIHDAPMDLVVCRQEGGAGFAALADARLTGLPGVFMVSRGPGACNASIALHTAEQDAVPLILLIGQVEARDLRRDAFQEIDYRRMFGGFCKFVGEATGPEQVPELIARAWAAATGGVPGPVVLSLPEDVLAEDCPVRMVEPTRVEAAAPDPAPLAALLRAAERPILLAGHGLEGEGGRAALRRFAEAWNLPVAVSFRRQDLFPNDHPLYAGDMGLRNPDAQRDAFAEADLVVALGTRLTDITTQGYSWPAPGQRLVHVCPDPRFLGWHFPADPAITADARALLAAMEREAPGFPKGRTAWCERLRALHVADTKVARRDWPDGLPFAEVAQAIGEALPEDGILTLDAGTFGAPFYRKVSWKPGQRLLAPISGAMGFGAPAAVAAALRCPGRTVACAVGDGGALMTGGELAVALERKLPIKLILSENGGYASIRIHQEHQHPGRVSGTMFGNPDFGRWIESFGLPLLRVNTRDDFAAMREAIRRPGPAGILVRTSMEAVLPRRSALAAE
ncbi:thiamine pyrophosphate-binding protein [Sabulicella rubraurantiaca]|uniref:thiamine pyrophosphate-binding protein n=1 Tax=Sabulicella rubraurantiaca TaxID=2811429 RepID=UPI001A977F40|nr:thiamine pyrophosphate-binding protein [Sabulicella rubraurantiaca]